MAQTGFTPIQLYSTSTAAAAPVAGNLTNNTLGSELAINITDGKLFYKDNANAVQVIGWKTTPTTAGGTGLTTYTAGDLSYYASGTTFTKLAIGTTGQILTSTGSAPQWSTLSGVAVTTFSAGTTGFTPNSATSGAITLAGTLITSNGGTGLSSYTAGDLSYYASGTALTNLAIGATGRFLSSTGSAPQWSAPAALTKTDDTNVTLTLGGSASTSLLNAASLTLGWTGTLATSRGGTGLSAFTANQVFYASSTSAIGQSANLTFNGTTLTANTIGAFTLSGTIAGGGNQINNVIIGTSTPLAGFFTTLSATGVATFSAGTVSAPAITTTGDTNTGIYFPAADTIGFTEGGVEALRLNSNGQTATSIAGTASLPSFTRTGDENTGIFFPAADTIAFTKGGAESMRIFSSGGVSVGNTTDPGATNLSVTGSVTSNNTFGYKNRLINGSMECISYGVSGTVANSTAVPTSSTGYITVDRWFMYATGAALSVVQSKQTSSGIFPFQTIVTGATGNTLFGIGQRIEDVNCCDMINKTCTLSAYLVGNGPTSVTWTASYANTANTFGTIAAPTKTQIATGTFTISGTNARYSAQISVPAAAFTGIEILFTTPGVANAANFAITNVQFEIGSQTTSYDYRALQQEFPLCMRYRENGTYRWRGNDAATTDVLTNSFKVYKYATPTVSVATSNINPDAFAIALTGAPYDTGFVSWTATSEIA